MAIADRVKECIDKTSQGDFDNALVQLAIAFDATAKKEYPRENKVGVRYKRFLRDNQDIITNIAFLGTTFIDCRFGGKTIEEIIYTALRNPLLHEGEMQMKFTDEVAVAWKDGVYHFPKTFVLGGLLAVIGAKSNANQKLPGRYAVTIRGRSYEVNQLWGKVDDIRRIIFGTRTPRARERLSHQNEMRKMGDMTQNTLHNYARAIRRKRPGDSGRGHRVLFDFRATGRRPDRFLVSPSTPKANCPFGFSNPLRCSLRTLHAPGRRVR